MTMDKESALYDVQNALNLIVVHLVHGKGLSVHDTEMVKRRLISAEEKMLARKDITQAIDDGEQRAYFRGAQSVVEQEKENA